MNPPSSTGNTKTPMRFTDSRTANIKKPTSGIRSGDAGAPTRFVDTPAGSSKTSASSIQGSSGKSPSPLQTIGNIKRPAASSGSGMIGKSNTKSYEIAGRPSSGRPRFISGRPDHDRPGDHRGPGHGNRLRFTIGGCRRDYHHGHGYYHRYYPCSSYYHPRHHWYFGLGFGFCRTYPVYSVYPVYTTVYPTYPVVYSSTTYVEPVYVPTTYVQPGFVEEPELPAEYDDQAYATAPDAYAQADPRPAPGQIDVPSAANIPPQEGKTATTPSLSAEDMDNLMRRGVEDFAQGRHDRAAEAFLEVAMADPNNVDASLAYAVARFATGDYAVSAVAIRRGIRGMPEAVNSLFDIRDRYGKLDEFDRHLQALEEFVSKHPNDVDGLVVLGFVQHFTARRIESAKTFELLKVRAEADADLADIFLKAKPLEELLGPPATQQASAQAAPAPQTNDPTETEPVDDPVAEGGNDLDGMSQALITVGGQSFEVWLAMTPEQRERGLMHVPAERLAPIRDYSGQGLPDIHHGMLFVFPDEQARSFWMKDTPVPLDVAYIDSDGRIVSTATMAALGTKKYPSGEPIRFALEVPAGLLYRLGIKTGDHVEIPEGLPDASR